MTRALALIAMMAIGQAESTPFAHITEQQARGLLSSAVAANKADAKKSIELEFMGSIGALAPDYAPFQNRTVFSSEAISINLIGRIDIFSTGLSERLRKMEPLAGISWPLGFQVFVSPTQIGAPDVIKVVVTRDGAQVAPLENSLTIQTLSTRMGATRQIHTGAVTYPESAFLPGAVVTVTAIPESGQNMAKTFNDFELKRIQ